MIRAMMLSAGRGTRLGDLTSDIPKPMIPLAGKPILEHNVDWLRHSGVSDLVINLHHRGDRIQAHFGDGSRFGVNITYSFEPTLLGTAGAMRPVRHHFTSTFVVVYADNLLRCNFDRFLEAHRRGGGLGTMALHERSDVARSGVARVEADGRIVDFVEKPEHPENLGTFVNAGLLLWEPDVFRYIGDEGAPDFSRDVIPNVIGAGERLHSYVMRSPDEMLLWIDRPEDLAAAQRIARERLVTL